ncbi:hypothetical protein ABG849_04520 [Phocaeicola vulgatus]|jgi:hypothetical protein|uniref:hypothetical protein n=1 Tax=Phocaeicola vulgatus TaxID=821 RepID=UPI001E57954F|nr:hypothetical protein [Phocaeicola vulgatus]MDC1570850.1 hypothetical protein [Phocaeicola vulgatus]
MEITPKAMEITPKAMEITPKAMEIEYIRIKRFNQEIEKVYATGSDLLLFPQ